MTEPVRGERDLVPEGVAHRGRAHLGDAVNIVVGELELESSEGVPQLISATRSNNKVRYTGTGEQPGKADLRDRGTTFGGDFVESRSIMS